MIIRILHFVGEQNSINVHVDLLLAPYQEYWQLDRFVAHLFYKAVASFPGSPKREMYTRGEPGIFST